MARLVAPEADAFAAAVGRAARRSRGRARARGARPAGSRTRSTAARSTSRRTAEAVRRLAARAPRPAGGRRGRGALEPVTVLVTGATGFTGGHLAATLARRGTAVRALVRARSRGRFDASAAAAAGVVACEGDLASADALARACDGVDVVYHIAATYREAGQPDAAYRAVNVDGTRHLLDAARARGVRRVVHCSTGGVHGHIAHPPANEDAPLQSRRRLPGDQARGRDPRPHLRTDARPRRRGGAADRHPRAGRHALPEDVPRPGARPLPDARLGPGVLPPHLHRRSGRGLPAVRRGAGRAPAAPTSWPASATRR